MSNLKCGERVIRCLLGQEMDHIPFGVGIGWYPWGETLERWKAETGQENLNYKEILGFDGSFTTPAMYSGIFPAFETQILQEDDEFITIRDERGITSRNRKDGHSIPEYIDYPVKTPDDWENLKEDKLRIDEPQRIAQDWDAFRNHLSVWGEAVQVGSFPYGVFGTVRDFMGAEAVLTAFYDWPEMVEDMMNHLTTLWLSVWTQVANEVQIDHIHIWEDMSGRQGSLISPAMIEKFMMPCYDRIEAFAKDHGVRIISVDSDGDCSQLVEVMTAHGVNMFFPFEVQAGNDILKYRDRFPELGIVGGLDKRALALSKETIDAEITKAAEMLKRGRYIPGFDHLIPPDVPWENFQYAAERIRNICFNGTQ